MIDPGLTAVIIAAFGGVMIIIVSVLIWLIRKHLKLKNDYEDIVEIVHGLNNDFRELYHSTLSVDERIIATDLRINALDHQMNHLAEKITDSQQHESSSHPYGLAIQKVRSGASVSELMQTSGLSQDEAALLIRLHGSKTR
jgi:Protein of unknown function (DUF2802)